MTTKIKPEKYQKALDMAEAGDHDQALEYMQSYLHNEPEDAEALNDTGAILHCLRRSEEAIDYFTKAKNIQADSAEIVWNLCEALLCTGRGTEAMELFEEMQKLEILNVEVLTRTAEVLLENCDDADALKVLEQSLQLYPDQEILKPMIEIIKCKLSSDDQVEIACCPGYRKPCVTVYA